MCWVPRHCPSVEAGMASNVDIGFTDILIVCWSVPCLSCKMGTVVWVFARFLLHSKHSGNTIFGFPKLLDSRQLSLSCNLLKVRLQTHDCASLKLGLICPTGYMTWIISIN